MQLLGGCVGGGVGRRDRGGRERVGRVPLLLRPRQPRQDEEYARRGPHGQVIISIFDIIPLPEGYWTIHVLP